MSVCSGAYLLAEAGLLDGRRAATHWEHCEDLQRRYPLVGVEPDPIFVRDGPVWTSAGVTAGRAVERMRVEAARRLLTETALPAKRIAERCGFGGGETMRRAFLRALGVPPADDRARFGPG